MGAMSMANGGKSTAFAQWVVSMGVRLVDS